MAQALVPVATWGLTVSPNESPEDAFGLTTEPGTLQLTMAAIDPDEDISQNEGAGDFKKPRATVKMIVLKEMPSDDELDDDEDMEMADLLDEDESDLESPNGEGPSDPKKSPKEMKKAALKKALEKEENDVLANGAKGKGKGKPSLEEMEEMDEMDEDEDDEDMPEGAEEFVLCTLDPENHWQQPLNITIPIHENVAFRVTGTHHIHLTGNIVVSPADEPDYGSETSEDGDEDVDLSPDEDELDMGDEDESDELDEIDDPRITEVDSDEEEEKPAPKLIKAEKEKSKKRPREEDSSMLDAEDEKKPSTHSILDKALKKEDAATPTVNGDVMTGPDGKPLSKSQQKKMRKKMKDNAGNAVTIEQAVNGAEEGEKVTTQVTKESPAGNAKSVQFAEKLVQGPTPNGETKKEDEKKGGKQQNPRTVDGVTIDDKKVGTGKPAKKGDMVSLRYIGKLEESKKQFDANKKGPPFKFRLGTGEVIKGWDIGVQGMCAGGERRIIVPPKLGYGNKAQGKDIPANSTLTFDVKVLEVHPGGKK